ncbi:HNH endonuclease [Nocardia fluminea]|uniref:HNH endonuclease n=1 Tax=Nocardia fluminea TaxID=134984 RepID=UPI003664E30B
MVVPEPYVAYDPSNFTAWLASLTPLGAASGSGTAEKPKVHNVNGMTPASAARAYERMLGVRAMDSRALDGNPSAQAISDPVTTTPPRPAPDTTTPGTTTMPPPNVAPTPPSDQAVADEKAKQAKLEAEQKKRAETEARKNQQPAEQQPASVQPPPGNTDTSPSTTQQQPAPTVQAPATDSPSTSPLQDMGLLPGGKPLPAMSYQPTSEPSSNLSVVTDLILPQGSDTRQVSQDTNGVTITATQIDIPSLPTIVGTSVHGTPIELEVAGICALPVSVPATSPLPGSITTPDTIFRTGRGYTGEQLRADLDTIAAGESGLNSAEAGLAAVAARTRLTSAMYTPTEQFNDLQWANREPRTDAEERDRFAARTRLNEAGIPWTDPRIQAWVDNKLDIAIATDPTIPTRYQAPPLFSPYEIRQQQIEANRVDITGNDFRQGANDLLAAITYRPALVLWEAAHDRGDHSGADIAWAAAELGLNVVGIVPGVGALTGIAAKATVRRLAPEFWSVLTTTDDVVDAVRAGQALQDARVTNSALDYRQKFVLDRSPAPSPGANAIDSALAHLPSAAAAPGPASAPGLHTTIRGLPEAAASRPVHLADDFAPTPAAVNGVELPLNQILANEGMIAQAAKNFVADVEQFVMLEARIPATAMAGVGGRGAAASGARNSAGNTGSLNTNRASTSGTRSSGGLQGSAVSSPRSTANWGNALRPPTDPGSYHSGPYNPRAMRDLLEGGNGSGNVSSNTIAEAGGKMVHMAGKRHPVTSVPYDERGFPIFDEFAVYDTRLPSAAFYSVEYRQQMKMASRDLYAAIQRGEVDASKFTEKQLRQLKSGASEIDDLTWHHHQDRARMQLVDRWIHGKTGHIGGESMSKGR